MPDVLTPEQRRRCMSAIKGKNTKPERILRYILWQSGFRYRLRSFLPGRPDLVFPRVKLAVFIDGCFWHGCPKHFVPPKTRANFWREKIRRNKTRDRLVVKELRRLNWHVARIWEHEIKEDPQRAANEIKSVYLLAIATLSNSRKISDKVDG